MPKNQKKQVVYCPHHDFSLTPIKSQVYFKQSIALSFCKGKVQIITRGRQPKKNTGQQNCCCFPIFNKDCNYATSSFILPEQQQNFIENSQKLKLEHERRVQDYNEEKSKLLIPKPKTRYSYCNTCRQNYQDYLEHISRQSHKDNSKKSKISQYIRDIQKNYENSYVQGKVKMANKNVKNLEKGGTSGTHYYSQPDVAAQIEQLGRTQKKVKMSNGHTNCNYSKVYNLNNMSGFQSTNGQNMGAYYNNMPNINSTSSIFNYRNPHMFPALGADPGCHFRHNESDLKNLIQSPFHMNLMNYPYLYWPYNSVYNMNLSMELNANMQTMNNSANLLNSMVLDVQPPGSVNLNYSAYNKPIIIDLQDKQS